MDSNKTETQFKSVSGLKQGAVKFVRAGELSKAGTTGIVAEGTYEGTIANNKDNRKVDYKIRASNGDLIIVNAAGNLSYRMGQAIEQGLVLGTPIQVSYLGKTPMTSGPYKGTPAHSFDVFIEVLDDAA